MWKNEDLLIADIKRKAKQYIKFWKVEFECDYSWSATNVWSVFYVQNHEPTETQINKILDRKGISKMIQVIEVTEDEFYDNANDYVFDVSKEIEEEIQKVQKNLDELNQYYRITRLENDNGALLMEIIKQMQDKMQKMEEEFEELKKKTA